MYNNIEDLQAFYNSDIGVKVQRTLARHIYELWSDVKGLRVLGCGYAMPYLEYYLNSGAERVIAISPRQQGICCWPEGKKNLVMSCSESRIPLENVSVDRILLVHHLECCEHLRDSLREIWRVLKPNGRILVVVPNRMGFWARAEWSPFGRGHPFTMTQALFCLRENLFTPENYENALFLPPLPDSPVIMRSSNLIEHLGHKFLPFAAGVNIIECSKQIYAKIDKPPSTGSAVFEKTKGLLGGAIAKPTPTAYASKKYSQVENRD